MTAKYCKPKLDTGPTRYLYVSGIGHQLGTPKDLIDSVFREYGSLENNGVELVENKRFCFVIYEDVSGAINAMTNVNGVEIPLLGNIKVFIRYADLNRPPQAKPEPDDIASTEGVTVPGLRLFENFLSEEEEAVLLSGYCSETAPWEETLNRRVQHFGFKFNYRTLLLDYSSETTPIPAIFVPIIERMVDKNNQFSSYRGDNCIEDGRITSSLQINQLTLNEYLPGQGIASHIDTETCFGDAIFIISIGAGITMSLQRKSAKDSHHSDDFTGARKHVWLPRRSLLVLTGEARSAWSHCISSRTSDKLDGTLIERTRRVSLTFRQAILPGSLPSHVLVANEVEKDHVFRVYESIAVHWNHTRGKRKVHWHLVKEFLESLPPGSLLADVGSGDGKYFGVNPNVTVIGCDRSLKLLQVSREPSHETFCCDAVKLPYRSDCFDAAICIAVLHHLASIDRRAAVLRELVRITATGGMIFIQAWAQEQDESSRHDFTEQDVMVPWKLQKRFFLPDSAQHQQAVDNAPEKKDLVIKKKGRAAKQKKRLAKETFLLKQQEQQQECPESECGLVDDASQDTSPAADEPSLSAAVETTVDCIINEDGNDPSVEEAVEGLTIRDKIVETNESSEPAAADPLSEPSTNDEDPDSEGRCAHAVEEGDQIVYQRYCHVYKRGELEDLCSSIPNCRIIDSGWEKGNWFVKIMKVADSRLEMAYEGPSRALPALNTRSLTQSATTIGMGALSSAMDNS